MCEQCLADTQLIDEILPGFFFVQAQRDGREMKAGQFGLVECNDPFYIFSQRPIPDPLTDLTDDQIDALEHESPESVAFFQWVEAAQQFELDFRIPPILGWKLVEAARKKGYTEMEGDLSFWLFHHMGARLKDFENKSSTPG